ncbi:two component, sigma54 specific, transcriptional regulator, Fis family [Chlorobium limicola DSM 245]|uniref:Two component, sigma54 specific, transcriptional regulator, Fis family n=1 Tax=Chlorobium limicola (strain DSM 245 / NBRC 103803 / 6330) TaxID=290315 RepID=B3ECS9_CHLL2|nr:sigma-54 dependent transcriptional regulator [Chlorobium limicola]ACD90354.1 two component, sigma54 specific, transcriptional regulator, Fis family [Chlorobium limicola DSM 245]
MDYTILVVEDESVQLESIAGFLSKQGYRVLKSSRPLRALEIAGDEAVDIVLSDFRMPEMSGVELLATMKRRNPGIEVIIMTAYGSVESAIEAMKLGAADYITKPVDLHRLQIMIRNILERKQLISENRLLRTQLSERFGFQGIISQSSTMAQVMNIAGRVASSNATVLVTGETGTGKELIAKAVHFSGSRREQPFIVVNCAALPETLLESELFGHEKGAFTGADRMRRGRFEMAKGGTLFIDEVGEIPLSLQVKLLRVLQEKTYERVGSSTSLVADVRIVAATNRDLESMIREGSFRSDLYYRLNVVSIRIPPLRDRRDDIPPLIDAFIQRFSKENDKQITGISREAMDVLMKYSYPGNIRELENIVQQSVVLSRSSTITRDDLPIRVSEPYPEASGKDEMQGSFTEKVEAFEQAMILGAMKASGNVQTRAAEQLGISERHLRYKLKKYDLK